MEKTKRTINFCRKRAGASAKADKSQKPKRTNRFTARQKLKIPKERKKYRLLGKMQPKAHRITALEFKCRAAWQSIESICGRAVNLSPENLVGALFSEVIF